MELQQQRLAVIKQRQRLEVDDSGDSDDSSAGGKFAADGGGPGATFPSFVHDPSNSETPYPLPYPVERSSREPSLSSDHQ